MCSFPKVCTFQEEVVQNIENWKLISQNQEASYIWISCIRLVLLLKLYHTHHRVQLLHRKDQYLEKDHRSLLGSSMLRILLQKGQFRKKKLRDAAWLPSSWYFNATDDLWNLSSTRNFQHIFFPQDFEYDSIFIEGTLKDFFFLDNENQRVFGIKLLFCLQFDLFSMQY